MERPNPCTPDEPDYDQAMSRSHSRLLLLLLSAGLIAGCGSLGKKEPEPVEGTKDSKDGPTFLVGLIALVNPDQKFVLIQVEGAPAMPVGHILEALDATGSLSELVITPERKGTYITADIKSGIPRIGNLVMYRPQKQAGATPPTTPPETPLLPTTPNLHPAPVVKSGISPCRKRRQVQPLKNCLPFNRSLRFPAVRNNHQPPRSNFRLRLNDQSRRSSGKNSFPY